MKIQLHLQGIPRTAEICLALAGLIVFGTLFLPIAAGIKLVSRNPILFRQKRVGRRGREFILYKFRSMQTWSTGLKLTAADDYRLTRTGKWLRRSKLDELPQLWNVLRGEMSFVGPRPEVPEYVDLQNPLWNEILSVRPGMTDPVVLQLRNEEQLLASVEDRETFYLEVLQPFKLRGWAWFVRNKTWKTDLWILGRTFKMILLPQTVPPLTREELLLATAD